MFWFYCYCTALLGLLSPQVHVCYVRKAWVQCLQHVNYNNNLIYVTHLKESLQSALTGKTKPGY